MNTLREALPDYLQLRRSLGFKLEDAGLQLPRFVAFLEEHHATHITTALALAWAQQSPLVATTTRQNALSKVRHYRRQPKPR